jgi:hypothetical protein
MKIGIIGTGMVGQTLGGKFVELGHDVLFGTRDVEKTLARTEPDGYGNPPFSQWIKRNPKARLATFQEAAAHKCWSSKSEGKDTPRHRQPTGFFTGCSALTDRVQH